MIIRIIENEARAGVWFYRQYAPHEELKKHGIEVEYGVTKPEDLNCDAIQFNGFMDIRAIDIIKKKGVKIIGDFDDAPWKVTSSHPYYEILKKSKERRIECIKHCDIITTTTNLLADELKKFNKNVYVLPNALNPENIELRETKNSKLIFGWIGGIAHINDIELLRGVTNKLNGLPFETHLFGYRPDNIFVEYLNILSDNGKQEVFTHPYKDVFEYLDYYNDLDVSLAPLVDNMFNNCKSELKMIEAGFYNKACIVSDCYPYKILATDKNCLTVSHKNQWSKRIKKLINEPNLVKDLSEQLHEDVLKNYDLRKVTEKRKQIYEILIK